MKIPVTYQVILISTIIYSLTIQFSFCKDHNQNEYQDLEIMDDNQDEGNEQEELNDEYEDNQDQLVVEQVKLNSSSNELYLKLKNSNLNIYRKLSVNDMLININGEDDDEPKNDNLLIKAYYRDDIEFDCELPDQYQIDQFDWSVNGYQTGVNESSYSIILDKKIDSNSAFLNVSCMFKVLNSTDFLYIYFPIVHLDNYYFEHVISRSDYLRFKYQKQIVILTKSIFVILAIAILVVLAGLVYKIRLAKKANNDQDNKAYSEQLIA